MDKAEPLSPEHRHQTLVLLSNALEEDIRLSGLVLVDSGANGFDDDWSDSTSSQSR